MTATKWKHDGTEADTSMGNAPELSLTYTPDASKVTGGKINAKQGVAVNVAVKIGDTEVTDETTFQHTNCDGKQCDVPEDGDFWIHVKTCQLTITKTGGVADEPYVFTVKKDDEKYSEVTIVGNGSETIYELPVGAYTIAEDTGWSWRYTVSYSQNTVSLNANNVSSTITCTNTQTKNQWLNGFSAVVQNIYGIIER